MLRALPLVAVLLLSGTAATAAEDTFSLTVKHIGRDGRPAAEHDTSLVNTATWDRSRVEEGTTRLPAGRYILQTTIPGPDGKDYLSYPDLVLDKDTEVDLDARLAKPVDVAPPAPDVRLTSGEVFFLLEFGNDYLVDGITFEGTEKVATAHLGGVPADRKLESMVHTEWQGRNLYDLAWFQQGGVPTGFRRAVRPKDLAKVHERFGAPAKGKLGWAVTMPVSGNLQGFASAVPVQLPSERIAYYNEAPWQHRLYQLQPSDPPNPGDIEVMLTSPIRHHRAGADEEETFDTAVSGPALAEGWPFSVGIERVPGALSVLVPMFADGAGHPGYSTMDSERTTLYQDGVKVGENPEAGSGYFAVTGKPATFRLETEASRTGVAELSPKVSVAWTFRSSDDQRGLVALSAMRFAPKLDDNDAAGAGRDFVIPVWLRDQHSETDRVPTNLTVDVSYNAGATWTPAQLAGNVAIVHHPAKTRLVSLRAKATDRFGSTVEQTIINAYRTTR
ncbi:hypothetical protein [Actinocrispum sp. NPDC049592]|uniref:hypothetical protein n=1 Tax=Actinocrispum sp. NPDC049592 TaxID=3154835 RepID=UPI00342D4D5F